MALTNLTSPERVARALNIIPGDLTEQQLARIGDALAAASSAIRDYTDRTFEINDPVDPATPRDFEYDGSGMLDIDDAVEVTAVSLAAPFYAFAGGQWEARPFGGPVYDYITLDSTSGRVSREMGFTYNLDRYEGPLKAEPTRITVTAKWGWPEAVPESVQQATVWTTIALYENARPFISESIEGYTRVLGPAPFDAIPARAQALLAPYTKLKV